MSKTIAEQLRQTRQARQIDLQQVAQATHIRLHYLQALEEGNFEALPSEAQARGFLRLYAGFLGLDAEAMLADLKGEYASPTSSLPPPPLAETPPPMTETHPAENPVREIFVEIGEKLRTRRELLGLSQKEVERSIHLRPHYLQALESGDLDALPSPVQARGMLINYANLLGLDPDPLLLRFADGLQARLALKRAAQSPHPARSARRPLRVSPKLRRLLSGETLIAVLLVSFLAIGALWGAIHIFAIRAEPQISPTIPSIADVLLAAPTGTPTLTPTATPGEGVSQATVLTSPLSTQPQPVGALPTLALPTLNGGVQVYITVRHRAWMRVLVDGKIEFEGRVLPGSAYSYAGEKRVELLTGDGDALQVFFSQQDLGAIGLPGQVVNLVFTQEGIQTPTPTPTLTPTATPRGLRTPTSTPTP